ncbi:MAG: Gfo/Idh/MocA family oxidoreductase [Acidobacteria bacterium]|nr:Gfo/Idh/MocA family oxidoreductase [Acidobacteriota bacterium]
MSPAHYFNRRSFLSQTVGALTGLALVPSPAELLPRLTKGALTKVAVIGTGRHGRAILAELQKIAEVEVAAICDHSEARLTLGQSRAASAATFTDHRVMLETRPDITAVIVATPTHLHRAIVEDVIAAGRHVYCESPIASTVDDCRAMAAAAAAVGTVCHAGFQGRSNPTYKRAQPLVRTELRDVVSMSAQWHRKTSWRFPASGGDTDRQANWRLDPEVSIGLAGEQGAQQFDVAHWWRGSYPTRIRGRGGVRHHKDGRTVADTIEVDLIWADDVALRYNATLANSYGGQFEVVNGINGSIRLAWSHGWLFKEADAPTQGWEVYATRQQIFDQEGIVLIANATQLIEQGNLQEGAGLPHPSLYYALMDFLKSVTEGAPVACSMAEGARASIVGILANQAVVTGGDVDVPATLP